MSALSDVSSVHSICSQGGNATDSDCDSEQALDLKLLGAKATHASIANHRVLKKLQAHLGVKIDKVVVVRIGRVLDPDTKKGDPLSICPRDRLELAFEIESILAEITSISYRLEYPALSIIAKDDSVWSYNPVSKSTILNCNPQNMRKIIKCDSPRFDQFMKVLEITLTLLRSDKTATKRDLYYRHVSLFKRQSTVDDIVESIACSFCVPRHNLHILASPKGLFKGPLRFYMKAELGNNMDVPYATNTATTTSTTTDCISGSNGGLIPLVTQITGIEYVPAKSPNTLDMIQPIKVLVIEKEATFTGVLGELSSKIRYAACSRPFEDMDLSVHNETVGGEEQDWVLITGKGYPDKNTHAFVNLLSRAEFRWVEINESNGQYGGQRRMGWWWSVPVMSPPTLLDMMDVVPDALLMFSDSDSDDEDGMMDIVPNKSSNLIDTHNNSDSDTDSDFDCDGNSWFAAPRSLSSQQLIPMDLVQSIRDSQHHLPVKIYGLFDCDPYGIDILMCYMFGSKQNAYESPYLATPSMKWIGVLPSDITKYNSVMKKPEISQEKSFIAKPSQDGDDDDDDEGGADDVKDNGKAQQQQEQNDHTLQEQTSTCLLRLTLADRKKAMTVLKRRNIEKVVVDGKEGLAKRQVERMLWMSVKVEIQALPIEFLVDTYLAEKMSL